MEHFAEGRSPEGRAPRTPTAIPNVAVKLRGFAKGRAARTEFASRTRRFRPNSPFGPPSAHEGAASVRTRRPRRSSAPPIPVYPRGISPDTGATVSRVRPVLRFTEHRTWYSGSGSREEFSPAVNSFVKEFPSGEVFAPESGHALGSPFRPSRSVHAGGVETPRTHVPDTTARDSPPSATHSARKISNGHSPAEPPHATAKSAKTATDATVFLMPNPRFPVFGRRRDPFHANREAGKDETPRTANRRKAASRKSPSRVFRFAARRLARFPRFSLRPSPPSDVCGGDCPHSVSWRFVGFGENASSRLEAPRFPTGSRHIRRFRAGMRRGLFRANRESKNTTRDFRFAVLFQSALFSPPDVFGGDCPGFVSFAAVLFQSRFDFAVCARGDAAWGRGAGFENLRGFVGG